MKKRAIWSGNLSLVTQLTNSSMAVALYADTNRIYSLHFARVSHGLLAQAANGSIVYLNAHDLDFLEFNISANWTMEPAPEPTLLSPNSSTHDSPSPTQTDDSINPELYFRTNWAMMSFNLGAIAMLLLLLATIFTCLHAKQRGHCLGCSKSCKPQCSLLCLCPMFFLLVMIVMEGLIFFLPLWSNLLMRGELMLRAFTGSDFVGLFFAFVLVFAICALSALIAIFANLAGCCRHHKKNSRSYSKSKSKSKSKPTPKPKSSPKKPNPASVATPPPQGRNSSPPHHLTSLLYQSPPTMASL